MFNYTKDFANLKIAQVKKISILFSLLYIFTGLIYPIIAIMTKIGNLYVNIVIIAIFTIYSVVKLILNSKKVDFAYKMAKRVIDLDGLCINIYSIYVASVAVNGVAIIFATLIIIFWILKIVMNVLSYVIINEFNALELCVIEDIKPIAKWSDQIAIRLDQKPYFEFSAETPEIVKQIAAKANKEQKQMVKKSIKNTIDESYLEIIEELDANKDVEIDFSTFVTKSLQIKDVYLKKIDFIIIYLLINIAVLKLEISLIRG